MTEAVLSLWHGELPAVVKPRPRMAWIAAKLATDAGLTVSDLKGRSRVKHISLVRQDAMDACCATGVWSSVVVGRYFGGRDHTTVLHARKAVAKRRGMAA